MKALSIQKRIRAWHRSDLPAEAKMFDRQLGIGSEPRAGGIASVSIVARFGHERIAYDAAPYELIRAAFERAHCGSSDVVYDLGAGYGRVVVYGRLVTRARIVGIELLSHRATAAQVALHRLGLTDRACVLEGDVRDSYCDDGTAFFLYNPFTPATLALVAAKLQRIAKEHPIRLMSLAQCGDYFATKEWLVEDVSFGTLTKAPHELRFFVSA